MFHYYSSISWAHFHFLSGMVGPLIRLYTVVRHNAIFRWCMAAAFSVERYHTVAHECLIRAHRVSDNHIFTFRYYKSGHKIYHIFHLSLSFYVATSPRFVFGISRKAECPIGCLSQQDNRKAKQNCVQRCVLLRHRKELVVRA